MSDHIHIWLVTGVVEVGALDVHGARDQVVNVNLRLQCRQSKAKLIAEGIHQ